MTAPDWLQADAHISLYEVPAGLVNGEDGWTVELKPLSLKRQIAMVDDEAAPSDAGGLLEEQFVALLDPQMTRYEGPDFDLDKMPAPLYRWMALEAGSLANAGGYSQLGKVWRIQPVPTSRENGASTKYSGSLTPVE